MEVVLNYGTLFLDKNFLKNLKLSINTKLKSTNTKILVTWNLRPKLHRHRPRSLYNIQIHAHYVPMVIYPAPLCSTLSAFLQVLQQYFLKGGTTQFLCSCSVVNSSQYCVASVAGQMGGGLEAGGQRRRRQRRWRSRGLGPHSWSSDAGQTRGR